MFTKYNNELDAIKYRFKYHKRYRRKVILSILITLGILSLISAFVGSVGSEGIIITSSNSLPAFLQDHRLVIDNHEGYHLSFSRTGTVEVTNNDTGGVRVLTMNVVHGEYPILFEAHFSDANGLVMQFNATSTQGFDVEHAGVLYIDGEEHIALLTRR